MPGQMILLMIAGIFIGFAIGQQVDFPAWIGIVDYWRGRWFHEMVKADDLMQWIRHRENLGGR